MTDKLPEIKARHIDSELGGYQHHEDVADDCHRDRAWLLLEVERLRAENEGLRVLVREREVEIESTRAELDRVRIELGTTTIASNAAHKGWTKAIDELQQAQDRLRLAEDVLGAWEDAEAPPGTKERWDHAKKLTEEWRAGRCRRH